LLVIVGQIRYVNVVSSDEFVTSDVSESLRLPSFDNWLFSTAEIIILLRQMFIDLDLLSKCDIDVCVNYSLATLTYLASNYLIAYV